jgi:hypothetical protein
MPKLSKVINGCGYDPVSHTMGFRVDDHAVVIDGRQILIIGAGDESRAQSVLDWLTDKIYGDENNREKQGNHIRKEPGQAD